MICSSASKHEVFTTNFVSLQAGYGYLMARVVNKDS